QSGGGRLARRVHDPGRSDRRAQHPRRGSGHGGRHVDRQRSGQIVRPAWLALGAGGNLVQVPRLVPSHASGG
nr:hypothetical protein [Tanacetum cinerariifolium]